MFDVCTITEPVSSLGNQLGLSVNLTSADEYSCLPTTHEELFSRRASYLLIHCESKRDSDPSRHAASASAAVFNLKRCEYSWRAHSIAAKLISFFSSFSLLIDSALMSQEFRFHNFDEAK